MVRRFQCPNCGEHGWILSDEPTVAPRCLRCSHRLEVEPAAIGGPSLESSAIDDTVVSWLAQPEPVPIRGSDNLPGCASCGFEGLMPCVSPLGDTFCPTCLAIYRTRPEVALQVINCPNCQKVIELHERDRGKTIVCAECNYFLGCVLPPEKRRFNALPFLNGLLATAKN